MSMEDDTVARLCNELDAAAGATEISTTRDEQTMRSTEPNELRLALLEASGTFRGVAVALRGRL